MKTEIFNCEHCKAETKIKNCDEEGQTTYVKTIDDMSVLEKDSEVRLIIRAETMDGKTQIYLCIDCVRYLLRTATS